MESQVLPVVFDKFDKKIIKVKDIINPHNCLLKNASFSIKTTNN